LTKAKTEATEPKFEKAQILSLYAGAKRDILHAVLEEGRFYTRQETEKLLDSILKKGVK